MEKLTQAEIAIRCGMKPPELNRIIKGHRRPTWNMACKLGNYFNNPASFWMEAEPFQIQKIIESHQNDRSMV